MQSIMLPGRYKPFGCCPDDDVPPRLRLLDGPDGITFAGAGLVVMGESYQLFARSRDPDRAPGDREERLRRLQSHELVHYFQALGSSWLQEQHLQMFQAIRHLIMGRGVSEHLRAYKDARDLLTTAGKSGLMPIDLLEAGAVLEGYKIDMVRAGKDPRAEAARTAFPAVLDAFRHDESRRRYWVAFDWLVNLLGFDSAYELFHPLCLGAFNTTDPVARFDRAACALTGIRGASKRMVLRRGAAWLSLKHCGVSGLSWMFDGLPVWSDDLREPPVAWASRKLITQFDTLPTTEFLAHPWQAWRAFAGTETWNLFAPLVMAWSAVDGLVQLQLPGHAHEDIGLMYYVLGDVSLLGVMDRLLSTSADPPVHHPCAHTACPFHAGAMCHRWYMPPPLTRDHATCDFPTSFENATGRSAQSFAQTAKLYEL